MYFNSKTYNSDFYIKIQVVFTLKLATLISTVKISWLIYNSDFYVKSPSCVYRQIHNWDFDIRNPSCEYGGKHNLDFRRRNLAVNTTRILTVEIRVANFTVNTTRKKSGRVLRFAIKIHVTMSYMSHRKKQF